MNNKKKGCRPNWLMWLILLCFVPGAIPVFLLKLSAKIVNNVKSKKDSDFEE